MTGVRYCKRNVNTKTISESESETAMWNFVINDVDDGIYAWLSFELS